MQTVKHIWSSLLCSFLKCPHTVQQNKDTPIALTETLAPSWGGISHVILQVFSEWPVLHRNCNNTAENLLALLSKATFSRKLVSKKVIKLGFMTNGEATWVILILLVGNTPTEKSYMYQSQQVTSNSSLAQTVSTLQKYNTGQFLNSYFFSLNFWVSKILFSVLLLTGFIIQIQNNLQVFRIRRI